MNRRLSALLVAGMLVTALPACTINHFVHEDYPQYLAKNSEKSNLPHAAGQYGYTISPATKTHRHQFRSGMAGSANLWIVEFGKFLEQTLQSGDVQRAFDKLENVSTHDNHLVFELVDYSFRNHSAHISLKVTLNKSGKEAFSKTYDAKGGGQGGKMFFGGAFAMKNAIQQSTKVALDEILRNMIADIRQHQ